MIGKMEENEKDDIKCNQYTLEDMHIGMEESFTVQMTQEKQDAFCRLSGDINPLHNDSNFAKMGGYDDCVVYGMCTASFYSTLVGVYLPGKNCLFLKCDVSWNKPVYVGDILTIKGKVVSVDPRFRTVQISAHIENQNGEKVSKAKLMVEVRE